MDGATHTEALRETRDEDASLARLARLAAEAGVEQVADEARRLAERVAEGRFYVACVGQFKRGKSSLINALIGDALLPVGVIPVTSVVTVIRHGGRRAARVRLAGGGWQGIEIGALAAYVSERENPENAKGVEGVEVLVPSPLLASGMCLVDTPGIGSVSAGNTEATRAFVPHIDAALVVLGADPPISGEEAALVADAARHVHHLLIVLNKADRLTEEERREATTFAEQVLARKLGRPVGPVREVSATERLAGHGPARDFPALVAALEELARQAGSGLVRAAEARGLALLSRQLLHALEEERTALVRPLEESEQRLAALHACVAEARRSMNDLGHLLAAEEARLAREFSRQGDEFLERARPQALAKFRRVLDEAGPLRGPALRRRAGAAARQITEQVLDAWLPEASAAAEALYVAGMERFVTLANDFLERVASSSEPGLAELPRSLGAETGFRVRSRLFYTKLWGLTSRTPFGWLVDALRTRRSARRAVERAVGEYLAHILATNVSRVRNDFNDRVLESRRRLGFDIDALLQGVYSSAEQALARARARRAAGSEAVRERLERIETLRSRIEALAPRYLEETAP